VARSEREVSRVSRRLRSGRCRGRVAPVKKQWWKRLLAYGSAEVAGIVAIAALIAVTVAVDALKPWPLKILVDYVLPGEPLPPLVAAVTDATGQRATAVLIFLVAIALGGLEILSQLGVATQRYLQAVVGARITYRLAEEVFSRLQKLSPIFFARNRA